MYVTKVVCVVKCTSKPEMIFAMSQFVVIEFKDFYDASVDFNECVASVVQAFKCGDSVYINAKFEAQFVGHVPAQKLKTECM